MKESSVDSARRKPYKTRYTVRIEKTVKLSWNGRASSATGQMMPLQSTNRVRIRPGGGWLSHPAKLRLRSAEGQA